MKNKKIMEDNMRKCKDCKFFDNFTDRVGFCELSNRGRRIDNECDVDIKDTIANLKRDFFNYEIIFEQLTRRPNTQFGKMDKYSKNIKELAETQEYVIKKRMEIRRKLDILTSWEKQK